MKIITTTTPTSHQIAQVDTLCAICRQSDGISLQFPEQAAWYGFAVSDCGEKEILYSAMALFEEADDLFSLSAFTLPSMRRRGLFSSLLEEAVSWLESSHPQADMDIVADLSCPAAAHTLSALEAEAWYEDFQMRCLIPAGLDILEPDTPAGMFSVLGPLHLHLSKSDTDTLQTADISSETGTSHMADTLLQTMEISLQTADFTPVVKAHLTITAPGTAWLHDVETVEALRGQGLASCFLRTLLSRLTASSIRTVFLHVTSDNLPAVALYQKVGFVTVQTLSHFLY